MNKFNKLIAVTLLVGSAISAAAYAEEEAVPIFCAGDEVAQEVDGTWICVKS
ncbi:hypothetical protein HW114_00235 [Serratia symbiotica]|uniref:hypothetical protein n=1 Tax=Serratia symbiotica TaxID=138074 RepID=UPI0013250873|nr:hypothetical protein [Serratia symbiotica]MBF1994066.1 hypothetical protein [Serratia symbiotica]MBQ0956638.1 hypothetical protein [Serratia symbiotica]QTP15700.1 hypothetical protein GPZ83_0007605 [Serratia symbiotica]